MPLHPGQRGLLEIQSGLNKHGAHVLAFRGSALGCPLHTGAAVSCCVRSALLPPRFPLQGRAESVTPPPPPQGGAEAEASPFLSPPPHTEAEGEDAGRQPGGGGHRWPASSQAGSAGTLTSMASLSNMRSCRKRSSLTLRSWNSSSIWACASSSCCSTVSMWPMELLWGVLLLEMAESLRGRGRGPGFSHTDRSGRRRSHTIRYQIRRLRASRGRKPAGSGAAGLGTWDPPPLPQDARLPPLSGAPRPEDTLEKSGRTSSRPLSEQ